MSDVRDEAPDAALTRAVLEVEGVADVFSPASAVGQVPQIVTALVTGDTDAVNRVRMRTSENGVDIATRVAVRRDESTPDTARRVADALLAQAPAGMDVTVSVQISRIS